MVYSTYSVWLKQHWHRALVHIAALAPLFLPVLESWGREVEFTFNRNLMLLTGSMGLLLLVASFACTPISWLLRWPPAIQIRRTLGLYGFMHISLHLFTYAWLDNAFDLELMWRDLGERSAMSIGLVAFLLLAPLALTSTRGWQRRLGKRWRTLHRLVYLAAPLSVLHYLWLDRDIITIPIIYAIVVGSLLMLRLPWVRQAARLIAPPTANRRDS
jgi:sulfoxide reductase heme-binding subunit YedZ